jgi:hypothetical protein
VAPGSRLPAVQPRSLSQSQLPEAIVTLPLTDLPVVAGLGGAIVIALALQFLPLAARRSELIVMAGVLVGWPASSARSWSYLSWPEAGGVSILVAIGALLLVVLAALAAAGNDPTARATPTLAVASIGCYLCVPETTALRLVPLPFALAGLGVVAGRLRPLCGPGILAGAAGLAWVSVIDGQTRWASVIGAVGCIGSVALLRRRASGRSEPWSWAWAERPATGRGLAQATIEPAVVAGVTVVCSRVAGIQPSVEAAAPVTVATVGLAWFALRITRPAGGQLR